MNPTADHNPGLDDAPAGLVVMLALPSVAPSWRRGALCAQVDPELFFPDQGGTARYAKAVCQACEIKTRCLHEALAGREEGIWGGTTESERRQMIKDGGCPCCAPHRKLAS